MLVLDEPTSGLDLESTRNVMEPLRRLTRTRTIILISHDLGLSTVADRIVVLASGTVAEQGTRERLLATGGHYAHLLRQRVSQPPQAPHAPAGRLHDPGDAPTVRLSRG